MKTISILLACCLFVFVSFAGDKGEKKTINIEIKGMTCSGCVSMIEASLKKIDGVTAIDIDLEKGAGVIQYDASKVKEEAVVEAVEKAGGKRHSFKAKKAATFEQGTDGQKDLPDCCKPSKGN